MDEDEMVYRATSARGWGVGGPAEPGETVLLDEGISPAARFLLWEAATLARRADNGLWSEDVRVRLGIPWGDIPALLGELRDAGAVALVRVAPLVTVIVVLYLSPRTLACFRPEIGVSDDE